MLRISNRRIKCIAAYTTTTKLFGQDTRLRAEGRLAVAPSDRDVAAAIYVR